jgi:uncharacterized protein YraI
MWRKLILIGLLLAALSAVAAVPAVAQNGATWTGQYYNNPYLLGDPAFTRQESAVSFNWGTNSPGQGVGADGFSVRWATDVFLPAGTYRFWALADDNIRVTVDFAFNPLFDTFANPAVGQVVSGDVTLQAGSHHIQVDYREQTGDAYAYVTWANLATNPTGPNFPFNPPPPQVSGQWTAQYYTNPTLFGQPAVVRGEAGPSNNWGGGSPAPGIPADNFSARWTSNLGLGAGTYRITARADDGVRVFVNGSMVINQWALATGQTYTADITLGAGTHNVVVEYFEVFGDAFLEFNLAPVGAPQPPVVPPGGSGGAWLGYYFNNTNLSGSPAAILTVNAPGGNWGTGSPLPSVQADNFSVRWITTQTFAAGVYRVTVRADDGVRVLVNGGLVIDRWGTATGQTYTADVTLNAGQHTITVEFLELGGVAFLEYSFAPASATPPTPPPAGGASGSATVTAFRLNVRSQPSAGADILTKISRNETFPIVGCNTDRSWWQINVNGTIGWVSGRYINTANANCSQPGAEIQPSPTGYNIVAATNLNVRVGPSTRFRQIATMRAGESAAVVGRNASSTWWEVDYKGIVGWVIGSYGVIQGTPDLGRIPVTE